MLKHFPLITVVIPSYNHQYFVESAVKSVMEQTYPNIELIVIDDGSKDNSLLVLESLKNSYEFKLIIQENTGVCGALNNAITNFAKGEYIALLASDDFWHPEKLLLQMEKLQVNSDSQLCFSQAAKIKLESGVEECSIFPKKCYSGWVLNQVFIRQHVPAGTILFTRKLYDQLGGFDELLNEEDWDFVIRSAAVTPFVSINKPLLYYRSHAGNTMRVLSRSVIFHQKAKILAKNFHLVSPWLWIFAVCLHFFHDIILCRIKFR